MSDHLLTAAVIVEDIGTDQARILEAAMLDFIEDLGLDVSVQELSVTQQETKSFHPGMGIAEAKDLLGEMLGAGEAIECPTCEQTAKVYKRTLYATSTRELIRFYQESGREWGRPIDLAGSNSPDMVKAVYWGLLEKEEGRRADGSPRVGTWRITTAGEEFIKGNLMIQKYARVYNGKCLGLTGPDVSVRDCLGDKFDYQELMNN